MAFGLEAVNKTETVNKAETVKKTDCSSVTCQSMPKHYEELGCEAVIAANECCASR